jgi:hypothetical protein
MCRGRRRSNAEGKGSHYKSGRHDQSPEDTPHDFLLKMYEMPGSSRTDERGPLRLMENDSGFPRPPVLMPDFDRPSQKPRPKLLRL